MQTASGDARRVDLGERAVGVLLGHRLREDAHRVERGDAHAEHDLVFALPSGDQIHPERHTKRLGQLLRTSGLRPARLHDLRHARAPLLLASGTDISLVSKMLGHSSISITADTHLLDGVGGRAAEAADALGSVKNQPK